MFFKYKGLNAKGKKVKGVLEANSLKEAKIKLKSQNIIYSYLKADKALFANPFKNIFLKDMPIKELSIISRNLSIYLKSGISSIVQAISLQKQQYSHDKKFFKFFSSVETLLNKGKSFYVALDQQNIFVIPAFYKQSIKAAEESGALYIVLRELSKFLKEQYALKNKISNAFAYPLFIIFVSAITVGFMLSIVVPKITGLFVQLGQELPKLTKVVVSLGKFVQNNWIDIMIVVLLTIVIFSYLYKNVYKFAYFIDKLLLKLPLFGKIIQTSELAKFSYMVSVLLNSGVTFVQSIKLSSNTIKNKVLADIFSKASDEIVKGKKLSSAIAKQHIKIDKVFMQSISLGEETSQIKEVLESLSEFYTEENKDKLEKMISLLEPILMLVVGTIVGIIISAMLLPIFSINFNM